MRRVVQRVIQRNETGQYELLIAAVSIVFVLVIGLNELVRGVSPPAMLACSLLGLTLAWKLFSKREKLAIKAAALLLLGAIFSVIFVADIWNAMVSWMGTLVRVLPILAGEQPQEGYLQIQQASVRVLFSGQSLFAEVSTWWQALLDGSAGFNPQVTVLVWNMIVWLLAAWVGSSVRLARKPFLVILPVLGAMTTIVAYINLKTWILSIVLVVCFVLVAFVQHHLREQDWEKRAISYSEEIRLDLLGVTVVISFFLLVTTLIIPSFSLQELVDTIREFTRSEERVDLAPAIGLYRAPEDTKASSSQNLGVLPASQLIGNPPELAETVVMQVQASDAFLAEATDHPYWRSHTYEEYTGSGWLVGDVELEQLDPYDELPLANLRPGSRYQFRVSVLENADKRLYYTGRMITASRSFGAIYRSTPESERQNDFFSGLMDYQAYLVEVAWPSTSVQSLRESSRDNPAWIEERYLQLPENLPQRIYDLAAEITSGAEDPYSKAGAIESYLRNFPYTLLVSPPARDQDVVDYFLFDLQQGYCDYYASSMVVLSRAVGLPARLVVGYATGTYDPDGEMFVVTEADAHSWVEIYFPEHGWVEFEPTSGRLLMERTSQTVSEPLPEMEFSFPRRSTFIWRKIGAGLMYSGIGIFLALGTAAAVDIYLLGRKKPGEIPAMLYSRLIWFARKSKMPFSPSLTPFEFANLYRGCSRQLWGQSNIPAGFIQHGEKHFDYLVWQCVMAVYGGRRLARRETRVMFAAWLKLVPYLVMILIATWFRKPKGESAFQV